MSQTYTDSNVDRIRDIHGNFMDYLSSAYEVLRKIFSYLSLKDLENVSKAVKKWEVVVETTKKSRARIESFVLLPKSQPVEIWSEASFCLTFCLAPNADIKKEFNKYLAKNSQFLIIESRAGIIGTQNDFSGLYQQKNSNFTTYSASLSAPAVHLRIPSLPDVGIKTFIWKKNVSFQEFKESFTLPENNIIKCLLILIKVQDSNAESGDQKDDFILHLKTTQSEEFAVGGCLIDLFVEDSETETSDIITKYIVFYGDKVEAASTVLTENVVTKDGIDLAIEELKAMCPMTSKGVLFVFRCYSRHKISRKTKIRKYITKWEGDSIMKYFPSTPVIGCFGYGELGRKFPEEKSPMPFNKKMKQCDIWEYTFSTSIVYVGFNN